MEVLEGSVKLSSKKFTANKNSDSKDSAECNISFKLNDVCCFAYLLYFNSSKTKTSNVTDAFIYISV